MSVDLMLGSVTSVLVRYFVRHFVANVNAAYLSVVVASTEPKNFCRAYQPVGQLKGKPYGRHFEGQFFGALLTSKLRYQESCDVQFVSITINYM